VREWAILQTDETLKADDSDWDIRNSPALSALMSIASWVRTGVVHINLKDLIELEHDVPGIAKDLDTLSWQILLIKQQMQDEKK
jgi:hypothetical protein